MASSSFLLPQIKMIVIMFQIMILIRILILTLIHTMTLIHNMILTLTQILNPKLILTQTLKLNLRLILFDLFFSQFPFSYFIDLHVDFLFAFILTLIGSI